MKNVNFEITNYFSLRSVEKLINFAGLNLFCDKKEYLINLRRQMISTICNSEGFLGFREDIAHNENGLNGKQIDTLNFSSSCIYYNIDFLTEKDSVIKRPRNFSQATWGSQSDTWVCWSFHVRIWSCNQCSIFISQNLILLNFCVVSLGLHR